MDYKFLNDQGAFKAWGIGFEYEYDSEFRILNIVHARTQRPALYIDVDQEIGDDVLELVKILNKSIQIAALSYSGNRSIDLSDILDHDKLPPILGRTAALALQSFYLQQNRYKDFVESYNQDLEGGHIVIKPVNQSVYSLPFFAIYFKIEGSTSTVTVRDTLLFKALSSLSEAIIEDLIMQELLRRPSKDGQALLKAASDIYMLSCILNQDFQPYRFTTMSGFQEQNKLSNFTR